MHKLLLTNLLVWKITFIHERGARRLQVDQEEEMQAQPENQERAGWKIEVTWKIECRPFKDLPDLDRDAERKITCEIATTAQLQES